MVQPAQHTQPQTHSQSRSQLSQRIKSQFASGQPLRLSNDPQAAPAPQQPPVTPQVSQAPVNAAALESAALDHFETVLQELESDNQTTGYAPVQHTPAETQTMAAAAQTIAQYPPQEETQYVSGRAAKEQVGGGATLEISPQSGAQAPVEQQISPEFEMPVEVEAYLQQVEDHADQLPQEIVITDDGNDIAIQQAPKQPVIVVPVSPEMEQEGRKKSPSHSLRWLVEWSRKIMKMFQGEVIYWQDEN